MIYLERNGVIIRDLAEADAAVITQEEIAQGWDASISKYMTRLRDQAEGRAIAMAAECQGQAVGYINVYPNSEWGAFGGKGLPEIVDFGVIERFRRRGVGTALMDAAEAVAARYADSVYLGVGLHSGYGSAQRMYVKRGYIPDGTGVWYQDRVLAPYAECRNDDDLVLYMMKRLPGKGA